MKLSVAICTWNRAQELDRSLLTISQMDFPAAIEWELLIVNNNCSDHTDDVIAKFSEKLPIRRLFEPRLGLSYARNCAVDEARGELLVWTDDDVSVDKLWLNEMLAAVERWPSAAVFGGKIDPDFEEEPPPWIVEGMPVISTWWALLDLGLQERKFNIGEVPFGANLAFRLAILRQHRFDTSLGRKGTLLVSDEETKVVNSISCQGYDVVWVPSAKVRHRISKARMSLDYGRQLNYCRGLQQQRARLRDENLRGVWEMFPIVYRLMINLLLERACRWSRVSSQVWLKFLIEASIARGQIDAFQEAS